MINHKFFIIICLAITSNIYAQQGLIKSYYNNGKLKSEINYSDNIREGIAKFYYPNGNIKEELNFIDGAVDGVVKEYYEHGQLKELYTIENGRREGPVSFYSEDGNYLKSTNYVAGILQHNKAETAIQEITNNNGNSSSKKITSVVDSTRTTISKTEFDNSEYLRSAEVMPKPVGGMKAILDKVVYPQNARKNKVEGTVLILADIDEYGEVNYAKVISGIGHGCNESAKIAVFYAQFKPGMVKGKPVKVEMKIPIVFKLK